MSITSNHHDQLVSPKVLSTDASAEMPPPAATADNTVAQCRQMLSEQAARDGGRKQRPVLELATGTFNVSCSLDTKAQLECLL